MDVDVKQEMLEKLMSWLQNTEVFVQEQAPLLAQELLAFGFWWTLFEAIMFSLIVGAWLVWAYKWLFSEWGKNLHSNMDRDTASGINVLSIISGLVCLFLTIETIIDVYTLFKITIAPRVYLLDRLMVILK